MPKGKLTGKQAEVIRLWTGGKTLKQIAAYTGVAYPTVVDHLRTACKNVGMQNIDQHQIFMWYIDAMTHEERAPLIEAAKQKLQAVTFPQDKPHIKGFLEHCIQPAYTNLSRNQRAKLLLISVGEYTKTMRWVCGQFGINAPPRRRLPYIAAFYRLATYNDKD